MYNKPKTGKVDIESGVKTWQIVVDADGYHEGTLDDWPAYLQDKIYAALEKLGKTVELPVAVVYSSFHNNEHADVERFKTHPYFMWVVASEVVVRDVGLQDRIAKAAKEMIDKTLH